MFNTSFGHGIQHKELLNSCANKSEWAAILGGSYRWRCVTGVPHGFPKPSGLHQVRNWWRNNSSKLTQVSISILFAISFLIKCNGYAAVIWSLKIVYKETVSPEVFGERDLLNSVQCYNLDNGEAYVAGIFPNFFLKHRRGFYDVYGAINKGLRDDDPWLLYYILPDTFSLLVL